jgi:predicted DNA binding CopG/RHH family protein
MDEKKRKEIEALTADHERWDNRELGASEEHMRVLSDEEQAELDREIDEGLGLQHISIRLNRSLIEQLKQFAQLEGIGYQPLIRQVLTKYAKDNEYKLDTLLSASEAAERADKLFAQAIRLRDEIPKLPPLSNERIFAEGDYSKSLGQAQTLFTQVLDSSKDAVLKQHAKLRMKQIADLCQEDLQTEHDKKYGKRKKAV